LYHYERPHQGRGNRLLEAAAASDAGAVVKHERLGGLLSSYDRAA